MTEDVITDLVKAMGGDVDDPQHVAMARAAVPIITEYMARIVDVWTEACKRYPDSELAAIPTQIAIEIRNAGRLE